MEIRLRTYLSCFFPLATEVHVAVVHLSHLSGASASHSPITPDLYTLSLAHALIKIS